MEDVDCVCCIQAMIGLEIMTNGDLRGYLKGMDLRYAYLQMCMVNSRDRYFYCCFYFYD